MGAYFDVRYLHEYLHHFAVFDSPKGGWVYLYFEADWRNLVHYLKQAVLVLVLSYGAMLFLFRRSSLWLLLVLLLKFAFIAMPSFDGGMMLVNNPLVQTRIALAMRIASAAKPLVNRYMHQIWYTHAYGD